MDHTTFSNARMILEALIPLIPWLTESLLWEKSVNLAIGFTLIFSKPRNWCIDYDAAGYDGIFYCL